MQTGDKCIRHAQDSDIEYIVGQLKLFSEFYISKKSLYPKDDATVVEMVRGLIENHLFLIAEINGQRAGFIAGFVSPHFFNPDLLVLSEIFWWVEHKWRKARIGKRLMDEFIAYGKDNCDWIVSTIEENSPVTEESLLGYGFKKQERSYLMEI